MAQLENRSAVVVGATGLVGTELVQLLLADNRFSTVRVLVRKPPSMLHPKLEAYSVRFDRPSEWQHLVKADVLFSALGTTLKKAGSKEAQFLIDHGYQYRVAEAAAENKIPVYVLVSSAMASPDSRLFYTRMKGQLEEDVRKLPFRHIHILRPGMLDGDRKEKRPGERLGLRVLHFLNRFGIAKNQKPIQAKVVAMAMLRLSFMEKEAVSIYHNDDLFRLGSYEI